MSRLSDTLDAVRRRGDKALGLFLTNGFPGQVWMWEDVGAEGLALTKWRAPR